MFSHGCEGDAARQRCFCPCTVRGGAGEGSAFGAARIKGDILFRKREYPLWNPKRKALIGSFGLERLICLRNGTACARRCRVRTARRFASASIIRCCAAVGGFAALRMRYTPCGCRSADFVEVQTNFRLPPVSTMRRAKQCRYFARSLPPCYRHSRLTVVRRGCDLSRIAEIHGEAMYTALTLRSACSSSSCKLPMCGVKGQGPLRSLGGSRGPFSHVREWPPLPALPAGKQHASPAGGNYCFFLIRINGVHWSS